jgi:hypothetical protein
MQQGGANRIHAGLSARPAQVTNAYIYWFSKANWYRLLNVESESCGWEEMDRLGVGGFY